MQRVATLQALSSGARSVRSVNGSLSHGLSSRAAQVRGKRVRGGGGVPGTRFGGKLSNEIRYRSESVLESIRNPVPTFHPIRKWKIVRGDFVQVISGPHNGQRGRVLEVVRASNSVLVQGVNVVREKILQPDQTYRHVETEAPIYVSRVAVVCPQTDRPTRVGYAFLEDGTKVRIAKCSGAIIPRPDVLKERRVKRGADSKKDTAPNVVLRKTYEDEFGLYEKYEHFKARIEKGHELPT